MLQSNHFHQSLALLLVAAGAIALPEISLAQADVTWGPAQNTAGPSDLAAGGPVVLAINGLIFTVPGDDAPAFDVTIGGVLFDADNFLGRQFPNEPVGSYLNGNTSGDADYDTLIGNSSGAADNAPGVSQTSPNYTINGLTSGVDYVIQVWFTDLRGSSQTRFLSLDAAGPNQVPTSVTLFSGDNQAAGDLGQYSVGTFTAMLGTTQTVNFDVMGTAGRAAVNAIMVREAGVAGPGTNFCGPAIANSTGASAVIAAAGSNIVADNNLTLSAMDLPLSSAALLLVSPSQILVMNPGGSAGNLCIASAAIGRYATAMQNSGAGGSVSLLVDLTTTPLQPGGPVAIAAGETWNWQYWFRDTVSGVPTSNFSDAVSVTFQ